MKNAVDKFERAFSMLVTAACGVMAVVCLIGVIFFGAVHQLVTFAMMSIITVTSYKELRDEEKQEKEELQ